MADLAYDIAGLRESAERHRTVAAAASSLGDELAAIRLVPSALGDVGAAAEFATTVTGTAAGQARAARDEAAHRAEAAKRVAATAGLGQNLLDLTTATAQSATPAFGDGTGVLGGN